MSDDYSTPEGALAALENAHRNQDIESAVHAKDFLLEATLLLRATMREFEDSDIELISMTAEVLELGYRAEFSARGFKDLRDAHRIVVSMSELRSGLLEVTEAYAYKNGEKRIARIGVGHSSHGWHAVVLPVDGDRPLKASSQ